jgi:cation transport regulator ChaB
MYYTSIQHLPQTLQETLPAEAQAVYLDTYNDIWNQYATLGKDEATCSTAAHQIAWDAMTRQFTLARGDEKSQWVRNGEEPIEAPKGGAEKRGFFARLGFG